MTVTTSALFWHTGRARAALPLELLGARRVPRSTALPFTLLRDADRGRIAGMRRAAAIDVEGHQREARAGEVVARGGRARARAEALYVADRRTFDVKAGNGWRMDDVGCGYVNLTSEAPGSVKGYASCGRNAGQLDFAGTVTHSEK